MHVVNRRLLRQSQDDKAELEITVGNLSRKVADLQAKISEQEQYTLKRNAEQEEEDDLLELSVVVAATGEALVPYYLRLVTFILISSSLHCTAASV